MIEINDAKVWVAEPKKSGIELIAEERERQVTQEGWTTQHDDEHFDGSLAIAAACYAASAADCASEYGLNEIFTKIEFGDGSTKFQALWPWDDKWDKRRKHNRTRKLAIAGALIAAEIERLERENNVAASFERRLSKPEC